MVFLPFIHIEYLFVCQEVQHGGVALHPSLKGWVSRLPAVSSAHAYIHIHWNS